jgi:hypothetical protein
MLNKMDTQTATNFGLSSGSIALVLLLYKIVKHTKGHLLILRCCGRKLDVGFDVKDTIESPDDSKVGKKDDNNKNMTINVENPMKK